MMNNITNLQGGGDEMYGSTPPPTYFQQDDDFANSVKDMDSVEQVEGNFIKPDINANPRADDCVDLVKFINADEQSEVIDNIVFTTLTTVAQSKQTSPLLDGGQPFSDNQASATGISPVEFEAGTKQKGTGGRVGRPRKNTKIETDLAKYTPQKVSVSIEKCLKRNYTKPAAKQLSQTADARRNQEKTELAEGSIEKFRSLLNKTVDVGVNGTYENLLWFYMWSEEQEYERRFWMKKDPEAFLALLVREYPHYSDRPWLEMQASKIKELHAYSIQETNATNRGA